MNGEGHYLIDGRRGHLARHTFLQASMVAAVVLLYCVAAFAEPVRQDLRTDWWAATQKNIAQSEYHM